jgi:hypothetical protein
MSNVKNNDEYRQQLEEGYKAYRQELVSPKDASDKTQGKLDKIIMMQDKQLYWIRIVGILILGSAIVNLVKSIFK